MALQTKRISIASCCKHRFNTAVYKGTHPTLSTANGGPYPAGTYIRDTLNNEYNGWQANIWNKLDALSPAITWFMLNGDNHYNDTNTRACWDSCYFPDRVPGWANNGQTPMSTFLMGSASTRTVRFSMSDHDWTGNGSDKNGNGSATSITGATINREIALATVRDFIQDIPGMANLLWFPISDENEDKNISWSEKLPGVPVLVIAPDCRSDKINGTTGGARLWGNFDTIRNKIVEEVDRAKDNGWFIFFVIDVPWDGGETSHWDREWFWDLIKSKDMGDRTACFTGDQHGCGYDFTYHAFDNDGQGNVGTLTLPQFASAGLYSGWSYKAKLIPPNGPGWENYVPEAAVTEHQGLEQAACYYDLTFDTLTGELTIDATAISGNPSITQPLATWQHVLHGVPETSVVITDPNMVGADTKKASTLYELVGVNVDTHLQNSYWGLNETDIEFQFKDLFLRNTRTIFGGDQDSLDQMVRMTTATGTKWTIVPCVNKTGPNGEYPYFPAGEIESNMDSIWTTLKKGDIYAWAGPDDPNEAGKRTTGWDTRVRDAMARIKAKSDQLTTAAGIPAKLVVGSHIHNRTGADATLLGNMNSPTLGVVTRGGGAAYPQGLPPHQAMLGSTITTIDAFRTQVRNSVGTGIPQWMTEAGYLVSKTPTANYVNEDVQAKYLLRLIMMGFDRGFQRVFVQALADNPALAGSLTGPLDGLLDVTGAGSSATFRRRAAYNALKRFMALFRESPIDSGFSATPLAYTVTGANTTGVRYQAFQRQLGSYLVPFWREEGAILWDRTLVKQVNPGSLPVSVNFNQLRTVSVYNPHSGVETSLGRATSFNIPVAPYVQVLKVT